MAKQPKLSIKNIDIVDNYAELLAIPEGQKSGNVVVVGIGDQFTTKSGRQTMIPMLLAQKRADLSASGNPTGKTEAFFLGWNGFENIVRTIQNVDSKIFADQEFKIGMVIEGANLAVDYGFKPGYSGHEPVYNPTAECEVTSNGRPLYRNERVVFGPAEHTGLDIERDEVKVAEVVDLEEEF